MYKIMQLHEKINHTTYESVSEKIMQPHVQLLMAHTASNWQGCTPCSKQHNYKKKKKAYMM